MDIIYREIEFDERDKLLELLKQLNKNDLPLPEEKILENKWAEIKSDKKIHCIVAEIDGIIVSSCTLIIIPNLTRGTRSYSLIENVVTNEKYRKKGIGREILKYALSIAWANDCYKVMLLTSRKDDATLRFYKNSGFEISVKTGFVAYNNHYAQPAAAATVLKVKGKGSIKP